MLLAISHTLAKDCIKIYCMKVGILLIAFFYGSVVKAQVPLVSGKNNSQSHINRIDSLVRGYAENGKFNGAALIAEANKVVFY
jgi:hypothetical protein